MKNKNMEENPELSLVLNKMKSIIDKNEETCKTLGKSKQDLKESKDQCNQDLKNFYLVTIKKLEEAFEETRDQVEQEHDKLRGKLEDRETMVHKSTYALMPQIMKLAGKNISEISLNESKEILAANQDPTEIANAYQSTVFNFIPNSKLRKPKLGYLQLCNSLPSDFKLRILTPSNYIRIGKQVNFGIDGEVTAESLNHLTFCVRKETCDITSQLSVAQDKLVTFSFCPDSAGVYNIMACLFGQHIKDSPFSVAVASCQENNADTDSTRESKKVVASVSSTSSSRDKMLPPQKLMLKEVEDKGKRIEITSKDEVNSNRLKSKVDGGWKVGDRGIAKWEEDHVWYNAQVTEIQPDGKLLVTFLDYGNSDIVTKLVKNFDDIPQTDAYDKNVSLTGTKKETQDNLKEKKEASSQNGISEKKPSNAEEEEKKLMAEIPTNKDSLATSTENKFSIGDSCVARWEDDRVWYNGKVVTVNSNGSYVINFIDYGNDEVVFEPFIVETGADIPKGVREDEIDENVNTKEVNKISTSDMKNIFTPSIGEACVARWDEDCVWYNAKVESVSEDGSFKVNFIDYGNSEMVWAPYIVKSASDIPEGVPKENIDENVNCEGNGIIRTENATAQVSNMSTVESKTGDVDTDGMKMADGECKIEENVRGELKTGGSGKPEQVIDGLEITGEASADAMKSTEEASADGLFSVGDVCVAKWAEDGVWYNGVVTAVDAHDYMVMFSDYGNTASVERTHIVRSANAIPKHVNEDQIDEHVKMLEDGPGLEKLPLKTLKSVEKPSSLFTAGDSCVAKWDEDQVWYNGKITDVNQDGSFVVNFVDYGNSETIFASSIVKDGSKIPATIPKDQIDENVDTKTPENKHKSVDKALKPDAKQSSIFSPGDNCVARWDEDLIWYNGKIIEMNADGSYMVNFVDYGNTEVVKESFILQDVLDIPKSVANDEIDVNVIGREKRNSIPDEIQMEVDMKQDKTKSREIQLAETPDKMTKPSVNEEKSISNIMTKPREKSSPPVPRPLKQVHSADKWQPGDICLAQWSEDNVWYNAVVGKRNASGSYTVTFTDYGNEEEVQPEGVVRDYKDLRSTGKDWILDQNVKVDDDREEKSQNKMENSSSKAVVENEAVKRSWSVGDACIAMWSDDEVWYNAKIDQILDDGSIKVTFVDYGNSEVVSLPFIVRNVSQISQQSPTLDENVVIGNEVVDMENSLPAKQAQSTAVTPRQASVTTTNHGSESSSPSSRKAKSPDAAMIKSMLTPEQLRIMNGTSVITSLDILKYVVESSKGSRHLPVKKVLDITQDVKEPIGITVLQNRNIVIASTGDNSIKIFSPSGKVISTVQSEKPFKRPSDMFTLSTGDFVVRDDLGLHLFTDKGDFIKYLGQGHIDKCYGVTEDEKGQIVTINSAKAFPNSKPGSKGRGGLTEVGESDIFCIDQKTGAVVKRIEMVDIVEDKAKSKCRFLNYYKGKVFVVDLGLDCIYTINMDGNHAEMFGKTGSGRGEFTDPAGLILDDFGNMIVADSRNHRLQIWSSKNEYVGDVKVDTPLKRPSGIYLDKKYRELYVLNYWGNSMVKYRIG